MKKLFSLFSLALLTMSAWGAVGVTSLSEANALADGENFTFNGNAVVTICWKGSVYLRDGSSSMVQTSAQAVRPMPSWLLPKSSLL